MSEGFTGGGERATGIGVMNIFPRGADWQKIADNLKYEIWL